MSASSLAIIITSLFTDMVSLVSKGLVISALTILTVSSCGSGGSDQQQDPLVTDEPVAYVKRPVPRDENDVIESDNILLPATFNGGAALYIRDRASQTAGERNITDAAFGAGAFYDVKDVDASYDGRRLLFSMRAPQIDNADEEDQPKWRLWEYDLDNNSLRRVFGVNDDISGQFHDISPSYLPDGRIVFSSTRQVRTRSLLLSSFRPPYKYTVNVDGEDEDIFNLHVYDSIADSSGNFIQQITFSQGHDLQPTILQDGRVAFLRYDAAEKGNNNKLSIYTVNIDGSNMRIHYGYHSQTTGNSSGDPTTFVDLRELADGTLSAILQARESSTLGGDIVQINSDGFTDINQPTAPNAGDTGVGQGSITTGTVNLDDDISTHGYFNSAYPINGDQRFLVSWNPCRLLDENATPDNAEDDIILACSPSNLANTDLVAAPPFFGLWLYDADAGTQTPIVIALEGEMFTDAVVMEDKPLPQIAETNLDSDLENRGAGLLNIRSVYDITGDDDSAENIRIYSAPGSDNYINRPARFLRLVKAVGVPLDLDDTLLGPDSQKGQREILGYTPIEADGSVRVEVPADVSFYFEVVNGDGERISTRHRNFLQLRAGETFNCTGCHVADNNNNPNSTLPHGRLDAEADTAYPQGAFGVGVHFSNNTRYVNVAGVVGGETMADVNALANGANRVAVPDLLYTDELSSPGFEDAPITLRYSNLPSDAEAPITEACSDLWTTECSIVINYPEHIQVLWESARTDGSCISCHTIAGSNTPAGQLELTDQPNIDDDDRLKSYGELFDRDDMILVFADGVTNPLTPLVLTNQNYTDVDGIDVEIGGNTIPIPEPFNPDNDNIATTDIYVQSYVAGAPQFYPAPNQNILILRLLTDDEKPGAPVMGRSAAQSSDFFGKMQSTDGTDHSSFMSEDELRLVREWLDIGGQYYNDPL
jgi:hypothetical protein